MIESMENRSIFDCFIPGVRILLVVLAIIQSRSSAMNLCYIHS